MARTAGSTFAKSVSPRARKLASALTKAGVPWTATGSMGPDFLAQAAEKARSAVAKTHAGFGYARRVWWWRILGPFLVLAALPGCVRKAPSAHVSSGPCASDLRLLLGACVSPA